MLTQELKAQVKSWIESGNYEAIYRQGSSDEYVKFVISQMDITTFINFATFIVIKAQASKTEK